MRNVVRATVVGAAVTGVGWFVFAGAAVGQTATPTTTGSSTSTTPTTAGGSSLVSQHDAIPALVWALAFGVVTIGALLLFLYFDRRRSLAAFSQIAAMGTGVVGDYQPALDTGKGFVALGDGIQGPASLTVGASATYKVQPSPSGATFAWTVTGPGKLDSTDQSTAKLTVSDAGTVTLGVTVTPKSGSAATPTLQVKVVAAPNPAAMTDKVPFLGNGYGTVVVLLAVASVTAALGLTDVLNGQAVAGVLASLVTYSVARAAGAAGGGGSTSGPAGGGSKTGGG